MSVSFHHTSSWKPKAKPAVYCLSAPYYQVTSAECFPVPAALCSRCLARSTTTRSEMSPLVQVKHVLTVQYCIFLRTEAPTWNLIRRNMSWEIIQWAQTSSKAEGLPHVALEKSQCKFNDIQNPRLKFGLLLTYEVFPTLLSLLMSVFWNLHPHYFFLTVEVWRVPKTCKSTLSLVLKFLDFITGFKSCPLWWTKIRKYRLFNHV